MIRNITTDDLPQLIAYGEHFWTLTPYITTGMEYNPESVGKLLLDLMDNHYIKVFEKDDKIVGFIGVLIAPFPFNTDYKIASEMFFFVHPDYRGEVGSSLLDKAEEDLKNDGVSMLAMGELTSATDMDTYYIGKGYALTEQTYTKVL